MVVFHPLMMMLTFVFMHMIVRELMFHALLEFYTLNSPLHKII